MEKADSVVFVDKDISSCSFRVFNELRSIAQMCDVKLMVQNRCFVAHRVVLAAASPVFRSMFTSQMNVNTQEEFTVKEMGPQVMELLIDYAYRGEIKITWNNVKALMAGASFMKMTSVEEACGVFIQERLSPDNVLGIRQFAGSQGCTSLMTITNEFIDEHFAGVALSDQFKNLPFSEMIGIVSRHELNVTSEEQVYEAVISWIKFEPSRAGHFPELLAHVRLPLLSYDFLVDRVAVEPIVKAFDSCRDLVQDALIHHNSPEKRRLSQSTTPRRCPQFVIANVQSEAGNASSSSGCIYVIGRNLIPDNKILSSVAMYDPPENRWEEVEAATAPRIACGFVVVQHKLYIIGGLSEKGYSVTVNVFDSNNRTWAAAASMDNRISEFGTAVLHDQIYVCGGKSMGDNTVLNTVSCFDTHLDRWYTVGSMSTARAHPSVVALEGNIYALGGQNGIRIFKSVERYDAETDKWTPLSDMLSRRRFPGAAALNGKIYICGGKDSVTSYSLKSAEMYDPATGVWKMIASLNVGRCCAPLVAYCGKLYAIGGLNSKQEPLLSIEVYDPDSDKWNMGLKMTQNKSYFGAAVLP